MGQILLLGMVLNLIPDYLSLFETRWLLQRFDRVKGFWSNLVLLLVDALVSALIIGVAIALYKAVMGVEGSFGHTFGVFDITAIFFYSSFLTSLFAWLYCLSSWFSKLFYRTGLSHWLEIKDNPQNAIALVSASLVLIVSFGFTLSATPTQNDNPEVVSVKKVSVFDRVLCDWFPDTCSRIAVLTEDELEQMALLIEGCRGGEVDLCSDVSYKKFTAEEYRLAAELWGLACKGGDSRGCGALGSIYAEGRGVAQDDEQAATLFRQACEGGISIGCANLGWMYSQGRGVAQDDEQAVTLYRQACEGGSSSGCFNLGNLYQQGRGVVQDDEQAVNLYRQACEVGDSRGCYNLGVMYRQGQGVVQDDKQAVTLFRQACEAGDSLGCSNLGVMYRQGRGVAQDDEQAVSLFRQACEGGSSNGCSNLGLMYEQGRGVSQDDEQASKWYRRACEGGFTPACKQEPK